MLFMVSFGAASLFCGSIIPVSVKRVFFTALSPVFEKVSAFADSVAAGSVFFSSRKELHEKIDALQKENEKLAARTASLLIAGMENEELKELLGLQSAFPRFNLVSAHSIGFVRDGRDEYIFISKGVKDGVYSDLFVIDGGTTIVGRVTEAYSSAAKVKLITSETEAVNGMFADSRVPALVRGNNFRELQIDLVPENISVSAGDEIVLSEQKDYVGFSPRIGRVVEVGSSESGVFKEVKAIHSFDPQSFGPVFVVKKP